MKIADLYPIKSETIDKLFQDIYKIKADNVIQTKHDLVSFVEHTNKSYYEGKLRTYTVNDKSITVYDVAKSISKPTINRIIGCLYSDNITNTVIITLKYSNSVSMAIKLFNRIKKTNFRIKKINEFFNVNSTETPNFDEKNITLSIRVPKNGLPKWGVKHTPTQIDIYKILNQENSTKLQTESNLNKTELLNSFLKAFYEFSNILNEGKNVTSNKWNKILESKKVFNYLDKAFPNEEDLMKIISGGN